MAAAISVRAVPVSKRGGSYGAKGVCHDLVAYPPNTPVRRVMVTAEKTQGAALASRGAFSGSKGQAAIAVDIEVGGGWGGG